MDFLINNGKRGEESVAPMLGKVIRRHRVWKDWSRKELALKAELSPGYIREIEAGRYDPSIRTLSKIANALEIPLWQLIREAEEGGNE